MATANERRALWFLAAVALSGSVVRLARSRVPDSAPDPALQRQIGRVDSVREARPRPKGRAPKAESREPKAESPIVDLNTATPEQIESLPGIGPALAARIVTARDSLHGFRDLAGLCGVRGVGSALVKRIRAGATISGERLPENVRCPELPRAPKSRAARKPQPR